MTASLELPLFPLHTVLFPGGVLPLRIFEPRYLEMVSDCLREDRLFGIVLISEGEETGRAAAFHNLGTLARITDWQQEDDGLLGITCTGERRFRILSSAVGDNQLVTARVELLSDHPSMPVPEAFGYLKALLEQMLSLTGRSGLEMRDDAAWVAGRMAEILPIEMQRKQRLLEMDEPLEQLAEVAAEAAELARRPESSAH
ncbi:MAG: LON peptidase substrate-binding domain-containing protein [Sedimenticola sp.]